MSCYNCKYQGNVPGSCHSSCQHPLAKAVGFNATIIILNLGHMTIEDSSTKDIIFKVEGEPHGIRNGWFNWPVDFDPAWLKTCTLKDFEIPVVKEQLDEKI